jgi:hypothetical protein
MRIIIRKDNKTDKKNTKYYQKLEEHINNKYKQKGGQS